jgi:hypothetical protein
VDRDRFARHAVLHLKKKACLWLPFEKVERCGCRLGAERPTADRTSCGAREGA